MNAQFSEVEALSESVIDLMIAEETVKLAKKKAKWVRARTYFEAPLNALAKIGVEPRFDDWDCNLYVTGDKAKLVAIVRIFRAAGFALPEHAERPKPGENSWSGYYHHPETDVKFYLAFTSTVCRRVKVGTKMVEQDIYETQCGDITLDEPQIAAPVSVEQIEEIPF